MRGYENMKYFGGSAWMEDNTFETWA